MITILSKLWLALMATMIIYMAVTRPVFGLTLVIIYGILMMADALGDLSE